MSQEWSSDFESVSDYQIVQALEEDARFKADPAASCRGIFYGALFSTAVVLVLTFILAIYWWWVN